MGDRKIIFVLIEMICHGTELNGMNSAILKQILGHDDISTTFSIYTHIKEDNSMEEFKKLGLVNMNKETEEYVSPEERSKIIDFASWIACPKSRYQCYMT